MIAGLDFQLTEDKLQDSIKKWDLGADMVQYPACHKTTQENHKGDKLNTVHC